MEIKIKDIFVKDNIRTRVDESDVSSLMADIKEKGLLQEIGVHKSGNRYELLYGNRRLSACKKLGMTKINAKLFDGELTTVQKICINASENIHREDISPYELARVIKNLMDSGLNKTEAAIALSIPTTRVDCSLRIFERIPEVEGIEVGYMPAGSTKKGIVSTSVVDAIAYLRVNPEKARELLIIAHEKEYSSYDIGLIGRFLTRGLTVDEAIEATEIWRPRSTTLIVNKKIYDAEFSGKINFRDLIDKMVKGEIMPVKGLFL